MRFCYQPEISVILPTFNRSPLLMKAVQSVLDQDFEHWELIIVDDGSTDNTFETINPLLHKHDNIRYLKHGNKKLNMSRNAGIQASFGKYVTFIDSDDHYLSNHLSSRYLYMQENQDIDLIVGGVFTYNDLFVRDCYNLENFINVKECIVGPTLFGKRTSFITLQGFKHFDYAGETELWQRALTMLNIKKIEDPKTYIYTPGEDSITNNILETRKTNK